MANPSATTGRAAARLSWAERIALSPRAPQYAIVPPRGRAPQAHFPIAVTREEGALAPVPINDRFPIIIGALTVSYLSSTFRLANSGYRMQLVDLLNELLENDPHLYSVVQKRILSSAIGRFEITPADVPEDHPDYQLAKDTCDFVKQEIARIPEMTRTIARVLWGIYYGLSAEEIMWTRDSDGWHVDRFGFIHSRRLAYPDYQSWNLHVWDQGQVFGYQSAWGSSPTNDSYYGLRISDWPGKFWVYAPQLRGDYPTRDGIGRQTAVWAMFKRVGARGCVDFLERFAKPLMDISVSTSPDGWDKPREASKEDIQLASLIAAAIGPGSGSYAAHPNSIRVEPKYANGTTGGTVIGWKDWISICNGEMSKAALGGTLGTEVDKGGGNRALGEVQERAEVSIEQYDAATAAESFVRDVITWIVRLNRPNALKVLPRAKLHVDEDPEPKAIIEVAKGLTDVGAPVDLDALAERVGIQLVPNEGDDKNDKGKTKPRRSFKSDVVDPHTVDPTLKSEEAKAQEQEDRDNKQAVELEKAKAPKVGPPGAPGQPGAAQAATQAPAAAPGKPAAKNVATKKSGKSDKDKGARKMSDDRAGNPLGAAIAIVHDSEGRVLTVSRPEPPHEMSIPGGHIEAGESPEVTVVRELREETGIEITKLRHVTTLWRTPEFAVPAVHVFLADEWSGKAAALEEGSSVAWLTVGALYDQASIFRADVRDLVAGGWLSRSPSDHVAELSELDQVRALLLSDKARQVPREVFDQLLEDYPAKALHWVLSGHWKGPVEVPIDEIDDANREEWTASHDGKLESFKKKIQDGLRKPAILVKTPGNPKYIIVDGHHRFLGHEALGLPLLAYVAQVHTDEGPWDELHGMQKRGSSKGSYSVRPSYASYRTPAPI